MSDRSAGEDGGGEQRPQASRAIPRMTVSRGMIPRCRPRPADEVGRGTRLRWLLFGKPFSDQGPRERVNPPTP